MSTELIPHRKEIRIQDLPRYYVAMLWSIEQYYGVNASKILRTPLLTAIMDIPEHIRYFNREKEHTFKLPTRKEVYLQGIPEEYGSMIAQLELYHGITIERLLTPHILQSIHDLHTQLPQKDKPTP